MDNFFAVFAREEVLKSRAEALRGDEAAYNWSIDRRPNFAKLTQEVFEEGGTAWAGDDDFALGERLGAFRHTRCHPIEKLVLPGPSVIGVRELYWPTRTLAEQRSEEHTSELQSLMRISYAVFCGKNRQMMNI